MQRAETQHGLITRNQLIADGWSSSRINRAIAGGRLEQFSFGIYRIVGSAKTHHQDLMSVILSYQDHVWLSHTTAANLHCLNVWEDNHIHVTSTTKLRSTSKRTSLSIAHHVSEELQDSDLGEVDGLLTTSVTRTLIDLAELLTPAQLAITVDDALQRRLTTLRELQNFYERVGRWRGRKRFAPMKEVLAERIGLPSVESGLERKVFKVLKESKLPTPVTQYRVCVDGWDYRLDMAYLDEMVGIEVDGYAFHSSSERFHRDRKRDNRLRQAGWNILHFSAESNEQEIIATVASALFHSGRRPAS